MSGERAQGKVPRSVYIKRRIAVLAGLLAVVAAIVFMIAGPAIFGSGDAAVPSGQSDGTSEQAGRADSDAPSTEPPPVGTEHAPEPQEPAGPVECTPEMLRVEAVTDATSYTAEQLPLLSLNVTNTGDTPCNANLGTETMAFEVRSGSELYWSSAHCQEEPGALPVQLGAGEMLETEPIAWDRTRSAAGACDAEKVPVPADGASYHLTAQIGGAGSRTSAQFLLY